MVPLARACYGSFLPSRIDLVTVLATRGKYSTATAGYATMSEGELPSASSDA